MTWSLLFLVPGVPVAQGSKVAFCVKGRAVLKEQNGKTLDPWRKAVRHAAEAAAVRANLSEPLDGPLEVTLALSMPRPAKPKFPEAPAVAPDVDKMVRAIFDALVHARAITDDSRVCDLHVRKRYAGHPGFPAEPGAYVAVRPLA